MFTFNTRSTIIAIPTPPQCLKLLVLMMFDDCKIACSYSRNACSRSVRSCWRKLRRSKKSCRRLNPNSTWWRKKRSGASRGRDDSFSATAPSCSWWPNITRWVSHHILIVKDQEVDAYEIFVESSIDQFDINDQGNRLMSWWLRYYKCVIVAEKLACTVCFEIK